MASGAFAAEQTQSGLDYVLRAGAVYSDNVAAQPSPLAQSASALAVGAEILGDQPLGRLRYQAAMELWYYQYLDYFSGGQLFGRGLMGGSYDLVPDHFAWNASVNFDQQRIDLARPLIPGNVENLFTLSTGPTLRAELFGVVNTQLDAHVIRALYSGNSFDTQTVGGRVELGHRPSRNSSLGIGGSYDDVTYLSGVASSLLDFQRHEVFLHSDYSAARTQFSGEFGYAKAAGATFDGSGPLARVSLTHMMSPFLSTYVGYRHEFPTSQVNQLANNTTPSGGGVVDTALVTSAPRESWTGEAGFRYKRTRSEAQIGFYHLNEDSLIAILGSHTYDELRASVTRHFTPRSSGSLFLAYSKEDFSALAQNFTDITSGFTYMYDFSRFIGLEVRLEYRDRNSNQDSLSYNEFNGGVFIRYTGSLLGRSQATPKGAPGQ